MARSRTYPVTYRVVNKGKRSRFRAGRKIPGATPGKRYQPVEVTVNGRADELRLTATKSLECTKVTRQSGGGGSSVEELRKQARDRGLDPSGKKDELLARLAAADEEDPGDGDPEEGDDAGEDGAES
ncbi:MAG: SAP domain-containing protein [bacterium]